MALSVVVPHVVGMLHARTGVWAVEHGARLVQLDGDDGYWRLLADEWHRPGDLVVVEQDIVPAPGVVADMLACPALWCTSPYRGHRGQRHADALGCARFSAALKRTVPDLVARVGEVVDPDAPARHWCVLDVRLAALLRAAGHEPHEHAESEHLHVYGGRV